MDIFGKVPWKETHNYVHRYISEEGARVCIILEKAPYVNYAVGDAVKEVTAGSYNSMVNQTMYGKYIVGEVVNITA